jgi:hypothetical protein
MFQTIHLPASHLICASLSSSLSQEMYLIGREVAALKRALPKKKKVVKKVFFVFFFFLWLCSE